MISGSEWIFYMGFVWLEMFLFMATTPVNVGMMEVMPAHLRGLALGLCTTGTHLLGDLIPPALIGRIKDATGSLVPGAWILSLWPIWCILFWGTAYWCSHPAAMVP